MQNIICMLKFFTLSLKLDTKNLFAKTLAIDKWMSPYDGKVDHYPPIIRPLSASTAKVLTIICQTPIFA